MYRGLVFADIHIGAMSYDQTYDECMHIRDILKEYTREKLLDFIIIAGDFFDKQLYGNDPFIELSLKLMVYILSSAKVVRIIYGTSSHDSDQYGMFEALAKDVPVALEGLEYNFRVINTVTEEELLPGLNVLYIPEEYIYDKENYYGPYLGNRDKYDYIFGHGMVYEAFEGRIRKEKESKSNRKKAPLFSSGELSNACRGDVIFGHYHVHTELDGNVSYVGSFSRWQHGEEEDKGFYQLFSDPENGIFKKDFVINQKAMKYVTIYYGYKDVVFNSVDGFEDTANNILKLRMKRGIDRLKVVFNIPVGYEHPETLMRYFSERFKDERHIKIEFNNGYVDKKKTVAKEKLESLPDEYRVFIDKNVPEEEKLSLFLKIKRGVEMSPEKIKKYLNL